MGTLWHGRYAATISELQILHADLQIQRVFRNQKDSVQEHRWRKVSSFVFQFNSSLPVLKTITKSQDRPLARAKPRFLASPVNFATSGAILAAQMILEQFWRRRYKIGSEAGSGHGWYAILASTSLQACNLFKFTSLGGGALRNQNNHTFTEFFWGSANQPHQWPLLSINSEICTNPVANFVAGFFEVEMQRCRGGVVRSYMDIYIYFYNCTCSCSSIYFSYFCWYLWSKKGERGVRANMATLPGSPLTSDPSVISTTPFRFSSVLFKTEKLCWNSRKY